MTSRTGIFPVLLLLAICAPSALLGQLTIRSWLTWRTVETVHFALHYPASLEAWTRDLATRIEAIDSAVTRVVGYTPTGKTDIVVDDPYEISNGSAWPYLDRPVVNLWATPPDPRDDIGEFYRWNDMVASHELAHVAHLARPSRNPFMRRVWQTLPVDLGPVAIRAPRWAIEGYATLVEGRVTGSGRPQGSWRPAYLRQWALEGQLPRYEQLDAWSAYEGGSFAYLAGSAFLEWLAAKNGDSSLVHVWRRLSARQNRTFDQAFAGVFGESPRTLYGRFSAELTSNAFTAERAIRAAAMSDTGMIVQRTAWATGDPSISPDGQRVALVLRSATMPSRVVVWKTAPEPDTSQARRDSLLRKRDPEDVPARPLYPAPKKPVATLRAPGGAPYESPRWMRDGRILLWRRVARGDGSLTSDIYVWDPTRKRVRRLTHNAALREPDPSPDGRSAVAMHCHGGWCDIVALDLANGLTRTLLAGDPSRSFFKPRLSRDGTSGVAAVSIGGHWRLAAFTLTTSPADSLRLLGPNDGANRYDASFISTDTIIAVSDRSGVPNVERIALSSGQAVSLTHVTGAAVAPSYNAADKSVWFLSLYSRGYDVRRLESATPSARLSVPLDPRLTGVAPLPSRELEQFATNRVTSPRPFRGRPRLFRWIPQPQIDADGASIALGLVSSDLIGRSELLLTGAVGNPAASRGAAAALTWRGTRPEVRLSAFTVEQQPSASRSRVSLPTFLDVRMSGGELAVEQTTQRETWAYRFRLAASVSSLRAAATSASDQSTDRELIVWDGSVARTWRGDRSSLTTTASAGYSGGRSFGVRFDRGIATAGFTARAIGLPSVTGSATAGRVNSNAVSFEQFTLGGAASPLVGRHLLSQRVLMAALPAAISSGPSVATARASLDLRPLSWYLWSGSTAPIGERFTVWHRVIGVEWSDAVGAIPLAGTPAARVQIGLGKSLDEPFRGKVRGYLSFILNP